MTRFIEWQLYNQQVDGLFLTLAVIAVIVVVVGWLLFKSSLKMFAFIARLIFGLLAIGLVLSWLLDWWPWA